MFQLSPSETEGPHTTANTTPSTRSSPEPEPKPRLGLQENPEQVQASCSNCPPPRGYTEANTATSKSHLFIFDNESQEDQDSHSTLDGGTAPANPEPIVNTDSAFALTQAQLEEDKQRITELMKETKQVNSVVQQCSAYLFIIWAWFFLFCFWCTASKAVNTFKMETSINWLVCDERCFLHAYFEPKMVT